MNTILMTALENNGYILDTLEIEESKFVSIKDDVATYSVVVQNYDEDTFVLTEVFLNMKNLAADFAGCTGFEHENRDIVMEEFDK